MFYEEEKTFNTFVMPKIHLENYTACKYNCVCVQKTPKGTFKWRNISSKH